MREFRIKVRAIILSITALCATFLLLRIALDLFNASDANILVEFVNSISDIFIGPFEGALQIPEGSDFEDVNIDAILALIAVVLGGILISEIITGFLYERVSSVILNITDALYKIVESIIFVRIILDLFLYKEGGNTFSDKIVSWTDWTRGITDATLLEDRVYVSTVIVLVIIVIFDVLTEGILKSMFKQIFSDEGNAVRVTRTVEKKKSVPQVQPVHQTINVHVPAPNPASVQNTFIPVPVSAVPNGQMASFSNSQPQRQVIRMEGMSKKKKLSNPFRK